VGQVAVADDLGVSRPPQQPDFDRQPPQDVQAEQSVLGGMLLSKDAIADVVEVLRAGDFYRPAHQIVYDTILDLYGRGEPADPVTVSAELTRAGQLMRVGGSPYLHTLISSVPTAANAGFYAEIVAERATLRRLVEAGTRIVQLGYGAAGGQGGDVDEVVDRAQAEIYDVTERRTSEDYVRLEQLLQGTMDEIDAISSRGGQSIGVPTGFSELDQITNGLHPGQMVIVAARPAIGKSTLALDFARACSIKHGLTSAIFSLEMSKSEITMRLLSAEAKVPLGHMRSGHMSDDDWARLARRMGEVADAPLYIDDSPNLTMMEIRAKARRLRQRHDLRLVIVDYLQLMTSGKRVESRQVEVSEFSRSLKLLAKELEVPVVALSQLNRGPEQRTDKKPMLSDLRESGCMTADTTILRADTGAPVTFRELMDQGGEGMQVWSLDEGRRLVPSPLTAVFPAGVKEVFRLTLTSGRTVKASGNHPFRTFGGWVALEDLATGDRVAVPRRIPAPLAAGLGWSEQRLGLLAHLLGDGCVLGRQPVHYTSQDEANLAFVEQAASAEFGIQPRRVAQGNWQHTYLPSPYRLTHGRRNPIMAWFYDLGIAGLRSYEKKLPDQLYAADDGEIRAFLRHLWATDGSIFVPAPDATPSQPRIYYSTSSRALADGVVHLLGRLDLASRLYPVPYAKSKRLGYHVVVAGSRDMRRFCAEVGVHGQRAAKAAEYLDRSAATVVNTNVDTLPIEVWDLVKSERSRAGVSERALQAAIGLHYCGTTLYKSCPGRDRLARIAEALDSDALRSLATDDVLWDRVVSVEALGPQPVYDATVKGTHNFVADGVIAHNSLEQDADMVVLLHREDAYERESPRAGEADLILAKHRNGPTGLVTVAFQGHYSRFVDMAG
jgi:replicative DNA helicase